MQQACLQEGFIFATPHDRPNVVRGSEDAVRLLSQVDSAHRGHVVDVVVPRC